MIDPVSVFSSIVCSMTQLGGSQVSDRCPSGYLFHAQLRSAEHDIYPAHTCKMPKCVGIIILILMSRIIEQLR